MYALEATFSVRLSWNLVSSRDQIFGLILMKLVQSFALIKPCAFLKMGHIGSKTRSLGQIIEDPMLVTKGLWFKSLLLNSIPHNPESSGEWLQGHHGPLVWNLASMVWVHHKSEALWLWTIDMQSNNFPLYWMLSVSFLYSKQLTLEHTRTLQMDEDVLVVKFSPNQSLLAVSLLDNTVKVFFTDTLKVLAFLP